MMTEFTLLIPMLLLAGPADPPASAASGKWTKAALSGKELFATFKTSEGDIAVRLFSKDAPKTVANFVSLASGEKEWTHPLTGEKSTKPLYNGTLFHRVIPGFMIQGGDPIGRGTGGPGYRFEDEFQGGRTFNRKGILAMANSGPNTNGSQFFITVSEPQYLNNHHTIFGEVIAGYDVVEKIANVPRGPMDRPVQDVVLTSVEISNRRPKVKGAPPPPAAKK